MGVSDRMPVKADLRSFSLINSQKQLPIRTCAVHVCPAQSIRQARLAARDVRNLFGDGCRSRSCGGRFAGWGGGWAVWPNTTGKHLANNLIEPQRSYR